LSNFHEFYSSIFRPSFETPISARLTAAIAAGSHAAFFLRSGCFSKNTFHFFVF
jgi:hypothetical protein